MRKANRDKGNLTPYEAFGQSTNGYSWDHILDRADKLPPSKKNALLPLMQLRNLPIKKSG